MILPFCDPWCGNGDPSGGFRLVPVHRDVEALKTHLFDKVEELAISETRQEAEKALKAISDGIPHNDVDILLYMCNTGATEIIESVLNREEGRPSLASAEPLLYKFAKYDVGFDRVSTSEGVKIKCKRQLSSNR